MQSQLVTHTWHQLKTSPHFKITFRASVFDRLGEVPRLQTDLYFTYFPACRLRTQTQHVWLDPFALTPPPLTSPSAPPPGCGGGRLHANGAVQPAPPAQPAQPLLGPGGQRARAGGQGPAAERHGERCRWAAAVRRARLGWQALRLHPRFWQWPCRPATNSRLFLINYFGHFYAEKDYFTVILNIYG